MDRLSYGKHTNHFMSDIDNLKECRYRDYKSEAVDLPLIIAPRLFVKSRNCVFN